ncbi:MAG: M81 family metallopeptidase [Caldilineaceae bacterium]|nr:M81 family metallopeptidase [Caldilineaceae bacterium]
MRVATGGLSHESSTFTPVPTTIESYRERFLLEGDDILNTFAGTNTPIGGFIEGAQAHDFELVPTLFGEPQPSAPTPRPLYDELLGRILDGIEKAMPLDGVLLELHGSMAVGDLDAADGLGDAEGHLLAAVRETVGPDVPVLAQLDIHSNVSQQMVEQADVLIGRETFPEIDMAARGRECADVLVRVVRDGLRPTMALHQIPMIWGQNQVTAHLPMRDAIAELHGIEALPGVVCGSIATCFYLADVPDMGASVYVVTDDDQALAQEYADRLGSWIYARREDWQLELSSTRSALEEAQAVGRYPIILADVRDNTGGGSPGDSTGVLRTFIDMQIEDACVLYIVDPEAVARCQQAGVGARLSLEVGAKSSPLQGTPVPMEVEVAAVSDGAFQYDGPMYAGLSGNMGPSAHVVQDGIHVLLVSGREQPFDTAFSRSLGLDPRQMRYICVKSAAHFRAGFESWAGAIHVVSEPSLHNLDDLSFRRLGRELYPLTTRT